MDFIANIWVGYFIFPPMNADKRRYNHRGWYLVFSDKKYVILSLDFSRLFYAFDYGDLNYQPIISILAAPGGTIGKTCCSTSILE